MNLKPSREQVREYVLSHPDATVATVARTLGIHRATVYRALAATHATPATPATPATSATLDSLPDGWSIACVRDASQETAPAGLKDALAVVLSAAGSGELDRADVARIVAARWDLKDGDRLHYDGGQLFRERPAGPTSRPRARRTVQQRGE